MARALLVAVRFHSGRYYGVGDWPPSPARLFQALIAGAARGRHLTEEDQAAFEWLETLHAPAIAAPRASYGRSFETYVPNNDLDAVDGDPRRISKIRTAKRMKPRLFDPDAGLLYLWPYEESGEGAQRICRIAEYLYQLGRGDDMAWASAELMDWADAEARLGAYAGPIYRPAERGSGFTLQCPRKGSLVSLQSQFAAGRKRFATGGSGKKVFQTFAKAPQPQFAPVIYDSPPQRFLFDLREAAGGADFALWPLRKVVPLIVKLRDVAAARLLRVRPEDAAQIERVFVGRGAGENDKDARIRIIPLPSIGHEHADQAIRRILVQIPPNCPIAPETVAWAFSDIGPEVDATTGEVRIEAGEIVLVRAQDLNMLAHYGVETDDVGARPARLWRTVTAAALPLCGARRRIDPSRRRQPEEQKSAGERLREEQRAIAAVAQALRHAGIAARPESIRVQREPFTGKGARAESFAPGTRFAKERLWHVEVAFAEAVTGPLVIGDGRYLGLGLMAPVKNAWRDAIVLPLSPETTIAPADRADLLRAVRRALMSRSGDRGQKGRGGNAKVSRLFSGHEGDGAPARSGCHEHVFLAADDADGDGLLDRVIVAAPWICDRSSGARRRRRDREHFDRVVSTLSEVRAGRLGVIAFGAPAPVAPGDRVFGMARTWETLTPYRPTRHARRGGDVADLAVQDVRAECARRGFPPPEVVPLKIHGRTNGGKAGVRLRLRFAKPVKGPLILGQDSHMGGGLFGTVNGPADQK